MLPLSYATRNLLRTPSRLIQLVLGSCLVVTLLCLAAAFDLGMRQGLGNTGDARNVLILGAGSEDSVERSEVSASAAGIIAANIQGLQLINGNPAVSPEVIYNGLVTVAQLPATRAVFRGVTPMALSVHRSVRLTAGSLPGPNEVAVGTRTHDLLNCTPADVAIGNMLEFEGKPYRISGHFIAPGSVLESEIWIELGDLMTTTQRDTLSSVTVRLDQATFSDVDLFCASRLDLELVALREDQYYQMLANFFTPILWMSWLTAVLITVGAVFGGLNTFYAAFSARIAEMGTLQAIGFRRWMILLSLIQEGVLATCLGTLIALALCLVAFDGLSVGFSTFLFALHITDRILVTGLCTGLALGLLGTIPPAWRCLSSDVPAALSSA